MFAARPVKRRPPGDCWEAGEGVWVIGGVFRRARREFKSWVDSGSGGDTGVCSEVRSLWWMVRSDVWCFWKVGCR